LSSFGGAVQTARRRAAVEELRRRFVDPDVIDAPWGATIISPLTGNELILPKTVDADRTVEDNTITEPLIVDDAIIARHIKAGEIDATHLAIGAVGFPELDPTTQARAWFTDFSEVDSWPTKTAGAATHNGYLEVLPSSSAMFGGYVCRVHDYMYFYGNPMPYDPEILYRLRARFRRVTAGSEPEILYMGMRGLEYDKQTLTGSNNLYALAAGYDPATTGYYTLTSYVQGLGATDNEYGSYSGGLPTQRYPTNPCKLAPDSAYFRPIMLVNYNTDDGGVWDLDYFLIEPVVDNDSIPYIRIDSDYAVISSDANGALPDTGIYLGGNQLRLRKGQTDMIVLDGDSGDGTFRGTVEVGGDSDALGKVVVYADDEDTVAVELSSSGSTLGETTVANITVNGDLNSPGQLKAANLWTPVNWNGVAQNPAANANPSEWPFGQSVNTLSGASGYPNGYGILWTYNLTEDYRRSYQELWITTSYSATPPSAWYFYRRYWDPDSSPARWCHWYRVDLGNPSSVPSAGGDATIYDATFSRSYRYSTGSWRTDDNLVRQASWGYGNHAGAYIFPSGAYGHSSISKLRIYIKRYNGGGYSSAVTPLLYTHNYSTSGALLASDPPSFANAWSGTGLTRGQGAWMEAPASWRTAFTSGTSAKGFGIYYSGDSQYDQDAQYLILETYAVTKLEVTE